jgi:hypothetical protein
MYPVQYSSQWVERRSRLSTFFRLILVIPAFIFTYFYVLIANLAVVIAWFAMVFTARYPEGLYRFACGALRNAYRVNGYYLLLTDEYPPFDGKAETAYPITISFPPPLEHYSRLKAFFRGILAIPVAIIAYIFQLLCTVGSFAAWFVIVFTGKMPKGLQDLIDMGMRYTVRAHAYYWLITETWPPLSEPDGPETEVPAYPPPAPVV